MSPNLTDQEYLDHAEALLKAVELNCDRINEETDLDIDCQRTGGMLNLFLGAGGQVVVNLQKPLQEVWLAAREGGYHYCWSDTTTDWRCTRTQREFFSDISRCLSDQLRQGLQLKA